jgi:HAD superfamily hydrolase (TIGR01509 family)
MPLQAILFGAIGTLVETSELQCRAFNAAFADANLDWTWDTASYQDMLTIMGGRARIRHYADKTNTLLTDAQVADLHTAKSAHFQQLMIERGLSLRLGVAELIAAARAAGVRLAFVSTTGMDNITAIDTALGEDSPFSHFEVVTHKATVAEGKPAPDVYTHVLAEMGLSPTEVLAIEDTRDSMLSAVNAGVACVVTPGAYVTDQDFSEATAVAAPGQISNLGWLRSLCPAPVTE